MSPLAVRSAGWIAHGILTEACRSGPVPVLLNRYQSLGGETIWVGTGVMHPRAARVDGDGMTSGLVHLEGAAVWRPRRAASDAFDRDAWRDLGEHLFLRLADIGSRPTGYGKLLCGEALTFPLVGTVDRVLALAAAYKNDSPGDVYAAALGLLGTGLGLTPSGDDLVAGSIFSRRLVGSFGSQWQAMAENLAREAKLRTSSISAVLFADHVAGESFEPLHELASEDRLEAVGALRRLLAIGHSSGWDMLAGFAIGAGWFEALAFGPGAPSVTP